MWDFIGYDILMVENKKRGRPSKRSKEEEAARRLVAKDESNAEEKEDTAG